MSARVLLPLLLFGASAAGAQSLERRVAAAPDGQVRFSFAARPGVTGNGRSIILWDCRGGRCDSQQVSENFSEAEDGNWQHSACDSGPVRVTLRVRGGSVTALRVAVGGRAPAAGTGTDLGLVPAAAAARYLLELARTGPERPGKEAVFGASLADSVVIWPDLLHLAKDDHGPDDTRRQAVFWLGQAAGEAAARGLDEIVEGDVDQEVRKAAVFALSQRPHEEGVPALIRVARTHRDPEIRRQAIFWLGQSQDPRALALFEELLTKP